VIVLDTHAWLWWSEPGRSGLPVGARRSIDSADRIGIAAISCFEVAVLARRGRVRLNYGVVEWIERSLALPRIELIGLTPAIATRAGSLGDEFPGDPADRMIVASALAVDASLVSKDERIKRSGVVQTIW
jgi:PIN domain nuclease of toxin-antitoxin system